MNQLINDIFGDGYITLDCEGGECIHFSQVPGYVSPPKVDNTQWIALSIAGAGLVVILATAGKSSSSVSRSTPADTIFSSLVCWSCSHRRLRQDQTARQ